MNGVGSDRNLLFGILALQVDFVTRDDLVAAMNAWALAKHKPLGQILVETGALAPLLRDLLEPMVEAHVRRNGGDPALSLGALSSSGTVKSILCGITDPDVQASLGQVASRLDASASDPYATRDPLPGEQTPTQQETARSDPDETRNPTRGEPTRAGLRFRILRPHAKGGIGVIHVAHDGELNREVALKEIQDHHADDPSSRSRFLLEAEVTGGLEHPGIVPVYGLGHHDDGRPFYAMRFIRGDSFKEAIEQFHKVDSHQSAARTLALQKLLRRFLDVCNAVAYAHSRSVLHRDLKPGNIMLGKFGETLVVDWGLAKLRGNNNSLADHSERPISPRSSSGTEGTLPGSAVGTPAYMSPEQAAGEIDRLGAPSDVYSLGATLYSLLTGRPPFQGNTELVLRQVQRGDFPGPRKVAPWVPKALEAICLKAMALRPEQRYQTPNALAEDIECWLADEPISAYRDSWTAPLARWARRHRSIVMPGTALLVASILCLAFALLYYFRWKLAETKSLAAHQTYRASLEISQQEARLRKAFAAIASARILRLDRPAGWTWSARDELATAKANGADDLAMIRDEFVASLASTDFRRMTALDSKISFGAPPHHFAFSPDGRKIAFVGFRPQSRVRYVGKLLDVETGKILHDLAFDAKIDFSIIQKLEAVCDLRMSPDGRWLAVGTSNGQIHLWDLSSLKPEGKPSATWNAHPDGIRRLAFARDALFSTSEDKTLRRWPLSHGPGNSPKASAEFRSTGPISRALEVLDGPVLALVCDGGLFHLDPATLAVLKRTPVNVDRVNSDWSLPSPDGQLIAQIKGWSLGLNRPDGASPPTLQNGLLFQSVGGNATPIFNPGGSLLLSSYWEGTGKERGVRIWDVVNGRLVTELPIRGILPIGSTFSADGKRLAIAEMGKIVIYEVGGSDVYGVAAMASGPVRAFTIGPDDSSLISVAAIPGTTGELTFEVSRSRIEEGNRHLLTTFAGRGHYDPMASASATRHPKTGEIAVSGNGPLIHLSTSGTAGPWRTIDAGGEHPSATFSAQGQRLWSIAGGTGDMDRVLAVDRSDQSASEIWVDRFSRVTSGMAGLDTLSASGGWALVGARNGLCYLFRDSDLKVETPLTWTAPRDPVRALAMTTDASLAAVGRQSGTLELRRIPSGDPAFLIDDHREPVTALAFSPDGMILASGSAKTIRLWKRIGSGWGDPLTLPVETGRPLSLKFSPNGRTLYVVIDGEAAIRVWHLDRLRERLESAGFSWRG